MKESEELIDVVLDVKRQRYVQGRGRPDKTRFKLNECFFVKSEYIREQDGYYIFDRSKIFQSKSGISIHINVKYSKEELESLLYS